MSPMVVGSAPMPRPAFTACIRLAMEFERVIGIRTLLTYGATEYTTSAAQPLRDGEVRWGVGTDPSTITAALRAVLNAHERHSAE